MFWTCANEVTPISQAKRFYPLFAILGNLGPIASGQTMAYVSRNRPAGMDAEMAFERTLKVRCLCLGGSVSWHPQAYLLADENTSAFEGIKDKNQDLLTGSQHSKNGGCVRVLICCWLLRVCRRRPRQCFYRFPPSSLAPQPPRPIVCVCCCCACACSQFPP